MRTTSLESTKVGGTACWCWLFVSVCASGSANADTASAAVRRAADSGAAATSSPQAASCQASGWDMKLEIQAFAGKAQSADAAAAASAAPVLRVATLYQLHLKSQTDVVFVQSAGKALKAATPMAGLARFAVPRNGRYRITLDAPLWIDVVTTTAVIPPATYTGWHDCGLFRKSVDYVLESDQELLLQFSDAPTNLVKVTIEPVAGP